MALDDAEAYDQVELFSHKQALVICVVV